MIIFCKSCPFNCYWNTFIRIIGFLNRKGSLTEIHSDMSVVIMIIASWLVFSWITIKVYLSTLMVLSNCVIEYWHYFCHFSLEIESNHMYFFCVLFVMASFYDDDHSLAGLTQEGHEVEIQDISSDDEPIDAESNFRLILEDAKALSSSETQISNFDDKIIHLSYGEWSVSQGLSKIKRPQKFSNSMASSMVSLDSEINVSFSLF